MKANLRNGIEAWFDVDDITLHVWGSTWTGREVVTICQGEDKRVVSSESGRGDELRFDRHIHEHKPQRAYSHSIVSQRSKSAQLLKFSASSDEFTVTTTDRTLRLKPIEREGCRKHPVTIGPFPKTPASSTSL